MTRREIREETFKLVFQKEFYNAEELPEQMTLFLGENPEASDEEKEQMDARVKAIIEKLPEIDAIIDGVAEGWKTNRMGKVELAIIRLATYEIKFEDLAAGIAINEAVEMAKRYGGDNSGAFVNGIFSKGRLMAEKNVYSVGQVNRYIKNMFAEDFFLRNIAVTGEISNLKYHSSGHIYFTLKDAEGEIKGIMFRGKAVGLKFRMKDGDKVIVSGSIEVYDKGGTYQIYANTIQLAGAGDLYLRFEELKKELAEMGMFAPEYKKPIPKFARRVGIITAPTGAAVRDIIQISKRRNPYVELILCPTLVQGEGAVASICESIARMDALVLDVLIVGRGGGSIEDLWAFNEEEVARAIFGCNTPVISAVGHETDTTIADYVADLRAPTPSAAAELAVFDMGLIEANFADYRARMQSAMQQRLRDARVRIAQHSKHLSLLSPENQLNQKRQRLLEVERRVSELMDRRIEDAHMRLDALQTAMPAAMETKLVDRRHRLEMVAARLDGASPVKKFAQGYSYTVNADGKNISSTDDVTVGDSLTVYLREGKLGVEVTSK